MDTVIDAAETFELLDWKRRIFGLYAEVRIASDPMAAWLTWRKVRDDLFRTHPSSPIPAEERASYPGVPCFDYDPELRVLALVDPVEASPSRSGAAGPRRSPSPGSRSRGSSSAAKSSRSSCTG